MKLLSAVLCDEVRKEDTGKFLIIGVYANNVLMPQFPATANLTLWMHFSPPNKKEIKIEIRVKGKNKPKNILAGGKGTLVVDDPSQDIFATFPKLIFNLEKPETLVFEIKQNSGRWQKILETVVAMSQ